MNANAIARFMSRAALRHRATAAAVLLVGCIVSVAAVALLPPRYEATATLLVQFGQEFVYSAGRPSRGAGAPSREGIIATQMEILTSLPLAEETVRSVGGGDLYPPADDEEGADGQIRRAARLLIENLSVRGKGDSGIIAISLRSHCVTAMPTYPHAR
jgi:uncharacterized protein involved in exopolysaccharide biosynthesis